MAGFKKVQLNPKGVRELLRSQKVQAQLDAHAKAMAEQAGAGYSGGAHPWTTRGRASVITAEPRAMRDNAKNQTLARVLAANRRKSS